MGKVSYQNMLQHHISNHFSYIIFMFSTSFSAFRDITGEAVGFFFFLSFFYSLSACKGLERV